MLSLSKIPATTKRLMLVSQFWNFGKKQEKPKNEKSIMKITDHFSLFTIRHIRPMVCNIFFLQMHILMITTWQMPSIECNNFFMIYISSFKYITNAKKVILLYMNFTLFSSTNGIISLLQLTFSILELYQSILNLSINLPSLYMTSHNSTI